MKLTYNPDRRTYLAYGLYRPCQGVIDFRAGMDCTWTLYIKEASVLNTGFLLNEYVLRFRRPQ